MTDEMYSAEKEKLFCSLLYRMRDEDGIIRCSPGYLQECLGDTASAEDLLEILCDKEVLVYVTRINKQTGDELKVIQFI